MKRRFPYSLCTLAAAYVETGEFDEAIKWQKKALDLPHGYDKEEKKRAKDRLKLYEEHKLYRSE